MQTEGASGRMTDASAALNLSQRFERLPLTRYQNKIFLIIATAWLFDSIDLGSLTFLLASITAEFGLSGGQAGLLASYGNSGAFIMAAGSFVIGAIVILIFGPETKDRVLEEVST